MRLFGLIGYPLDHSFSQEYFNEKWKQEGIKDARFRNFPIRDISEINNLLSEFPYLSGLAVTIPHKTSVIPFLHDIDPVAAQVGAVNCIVIRNNRTRGFNTDVVGFEKAFLRGLKPTHQSVMILGNGGASKAVSHVCEKLALKKTIVCRNPTQKEEIGWEDITEELMTSSDVVINCTPIGMYPEDKRCPPMPLHCIHEGQFFFDLIYNPAQTVFLKEALARGAHTSNGLEMLMMQAEENWKLWNS